MGVMLEKLIQRRARVALYLVDANEPLAGMICELADGFIIIADEDTSDAPLTLVDRDSIWCIVEQPATVTQ